MNLRSMSNMTRIDRYRWLLFREKLWFVLNCFAFMPAYTYLFFVILQPKIEATKNVSLTSWFEFWTWTIVIAHVIYDAFIMLHVNELRDKIRCIEYEMENKSNGR